jgi:hypothetical protein
MWTRSLPILYPALLLPLFAPPVNGLRQGAERKGATAAKVPAVPKLPVTPVAFRATAMPAGRLIPRLGEQAGVKLTCAPELASDVLLLSVKDRPLSEVMGKLAEAGSAEWMPDGNGFKYTRTPALAARLRREEVAEVEAGLRKRLKPVYDSLAVQLTLARAQEAILARRMLRAERVDSDRPGFRKKWEARERRLQELDALNPVYRLIGRCLQDVGIPRIAAMGYGERLVFSTHPTAAQKALARRSAVAASLYPEEEALWNTARKQALARPAGKPAGAGQPAEEEGDADDGSQDESQDGWAPRFGDQCSLWQHGANRFRSEAPLGPPARIVLTLERGWHTTFSLKLLVLDSRNRQIVELQGGDFLRSDEPRGRYAEASEKAAKTATALPPVVLSPMTRLLWQESKNPRSPEDLPVKPALDTKVVEWLTHPEENEPLSLYASDGFLSAAAADSVNLAACLSDEMAEISPDWESGRATIQEFLSDAQSGADTQVEVSGGWMVARPNRPLRDLARRMDRRALGEALRSVAREGRLTLDTYAAFLATNFRQARDHLFSAPVRILTLGEHVPTAGSGSLLELYGSLSPVQRSRLLAGGQVSLRELRGAARRTALRVLYNSHSTLRMRAGPGPDDLGDLSYEPTEIAPNGLYPEGGIRAKRLQQRYVYLIDPAETGDGRIYALVEPDVPPPTAFFGSPRPAPVGGWRSLMCEVRPVAGLHVEMDLCPWLLSESDYREATGPSQGPPVPVAALPPDLRKRVEQEIAQLRQMADPGGEGGQ